MPRGTHILSYTQQDHSVPALRNAVVLGLDDEVCWLQRIAVALLDEGANLVLHPFSRLRQVFDDPVEHRTAGMLRRKQPLDVLHHKDGWPMNLNDSEIFLVQKMLFVLLEALVMCPPRPPRQRIRLARRSTDQDPRLTTIEGSSYFIVDAGLVRLPQFQATSFAIRVDESCGNSRLLSKCLFVHLALDVAVVVLHILRASKPPKHCAQRKRLVRNRVFLDGKTDFKNGLLLVILESGKPLPQSPWAREKINDGNRHSNFLEKDRHWSACCGPEAAF